MVLSDHELDVRLKSVSEPNMKTYESLPLSPAIRRNSRHFATISFCGTPAPMSPLEASKGRRKQKAQTLKCLRFDLSPSFFGGNVPDESYVREIQKANSSSFDHNMPEDLHVCKSQKENTPFFGDKMPNDENGAVTEGFTPQRIRSYLAPMACEQPISVKNTFVHLDRSLSEDDDDDDSGCLPVVRCKSAPAMPALNDKSIGVMCATRSLDALTCDTPCSMIEYNAAPPRETSHRRQYDVDEDDGDDDDDDAPVFPARLGADAYSIVQRPLDMPSGSCSPPPPGLSSFSSMVDASCTTGSCSFRVKNTFVHIEVNKDEEEDGSDLPMRRVSEPAFKSEQYEDASPVNLPAAPTLPSVGAALHSSGQCKPCAWFWKPESCQWGAECQHCHLCPIGELRRRKKERQAEAKELKKEAAALAEETKSQVETLAEGGDGFQ